MQRTARFLLLALHLALLPLLLGALGCGGSSVSAGRGDADVAAGDVGLPDVPDTPADAADPDLKPLPDAADVADADVPSDVPADSAAADAPDVPSDVPSDVPPPADAPDAADGPGPADVGPPCPDIAGLLAEARSWLERAQPQQALVLYEQALALCPQDPQARFGAALSELVDTVELTLSLVSLVAQGDLIGSFFSVVPEDSYDEWLAEQLHWAFDSLAGRLRHALRILDELAAEDVDVRLVVERLPVYYVTRPLLVYRGAFDRGDLHLMRLVAQNVLILLDILAVQDFSAELMTIVSEIQDRGLEGDGVAAVLGLVGRILGDDPAFLTTHPVDGPDAWYEVAGLLAAMPGTLDEALTWLRAEAPTEGPQVSRLLVQGANESLVLAAGVDVAADGTFTEVDLRFPIPPELGEALARMGAAVSAPGALVPWTEGPTWLLGAWLAVGLKLDLLADLLADVVPIPLDMIDIRTAAGLLENLLPLPFAFDLGSMFAAGPAGLRAFLPRPNDAHDGLLVEWECPTETAPDGLPDGSAGLLCAAATDDGPHFAGTAVETTADGIVSGFPYFGWTDPTFHGLLHVDLEAIGLSTAPGWTPADQTSLNAGLAVGFEPILGLLSL